MAHTIKMVCGISKYSHTTRTMCAIEYISLISLAINNIPMWLIYTNTYHCNSRKRKVTELNFYRYHPKQPHSGLKFISYTYRREVHFPIQFPFYTSDSRTIRPGEFDSPIK